MIIMRNAVEYADDDPMRATRRRRYFAKANNVEETMLGALHVAEALRTGDQDVIDAILESRRRRKEWKRQMHESWSEWHERTFLHYGRL